MKKYVLILFVLINSINIQAQENETTTYYFIRHAEKNRSDESNKNPDLTEKGIRRAENWSVVFENIDFDLIYSTNYKRTMQTAEPTAKKNGLEIQFYKPTLLYNEDFKSQTNGKNVFIVGHSNTIPLFVNSVLGVDKYPEIEDNNNSNLYIIVVSYHKTTDTLLHIE